MAFPNRTSNHKKKRVIPKDLEMSIVKDRQNGMKWRELLAKYKMGNPIINSILKKHGLVQSQKRVHYTDIETMDDIVKLKKQGLYIHQIAETLDIGRGSVDRILKERGIRTYMGY